VCESGCKRTHLNEPISIREIKKFAVENDKEEKWRENSRHTSPNGKKVAVIGGGAAGMTAAYYLAKKGYEAEVFERQPLAGGKLSYGIPKYRLPQEIINKEVDILLEEGIKLHTETNINSVNELKDKGYDAILIAVGAVKGKRPPAFVGTWTNAMDAVDFCRKSAENNLPDMGETLTVYGGGNVGFDCARTAKKAGVKTVRIICMEARECMLADKEKSVKD
jgi:NADPH-dependent glutamate synthase beta subunit-like oxidoreductase